MGGRGTRTIEIRLLSMLPTHIAACRLVVGAILRLREANQAPFSEPMQLVVDKVLLQLFRLHHQSSAHKGAIQFFHISKSGGTNLCMTAEGNGCASEGFDEWHNCLIREFSDEPRWLDLSGHKDMQSSMHRSTSLPWFVNYAKARRVDLDCAARAAYLQQVRGVQVHAMQAAEGREGSTGIAFRASTVSCRHRHRHRHRHGIPYLIHLTNL